MDSVLKQVMLPNGVGLMALGLALGFVFGCCGDQPPVKTSGSVPTKGFRLRVKVEQFVPTQDFPLDDQDRWDKFYGVYKCTVEDPFEFDLVEKGQSINVVASIADPSVAEMAVGSTYVIHVDVDLPRGWESIADEFNDPALGMVALRKVE